MTIFYPDISSFQSGIDLRGALAVCCKVTEGTTYANPDYARAKANAASHGTFFFAYHFLHAGNAVAQARWCFQHAGHTPLMLDVEPTTGSTPTVIDVLTFVAEYRALGGTVHLLYLPEWYWQEQGSPSLTALASRGIVLVSSDYTNYLDSNVGAGWQVYGGVRPTVWQYTDRLSFNGYTVDFNAFRGHYAGKQDAASVAACLEEFKSIVKTGSYPPPVNSAINPVQKLRATARYTQADLSWGPAPNADGYRVVLWQRRRLIPLRKRIATFAVADTKLTLDNLKRGTEYEVTVLALPATPWAVTHPRATTSFRTL